MTTETSRGQTNTSGKKNSLDSSHSSADTKLKNEAKDDAEAMKTKAKHEGEKVRKEAVSTAKSKVEEGSHRTAEEVDEAAHTVDAVADALDEQDVQGLASYAHDISNQMSEFASSLSEKSADELAHDVKRIARKNPAAFLAGSIAIGFGLSRFFKASQSNPRDSYDGAGDYDGAGERKSYQQSGRPIPKPSSTTASERGTRVARSPQSPIGTASSSKTGSSRTANGYSNGAERSSS